MVFLLDSQDAVAYHAARRGVVKYNNRTARGYNSRSLSLHHRWDDVSAPPPPVSTARLKKLLQAQTRAMVSGDVLLR